MIISKELKEKYIDDTIEYKKYRRIYILINGFESSWKTDIKLEILTDESKVKKISSFIVEYLKQKNINLPYSIYNAVKENLDEEDKEIYFSNLDDVKIYIDSKLGDLK